MKKRNLIALLMAVCMMFSLLPVNAIAVGAEDAASAAPAEETLLSENGNVSSAPKQETPAKDGEGGKAAAPVEGEKTGDGKAPAEGEKTPGAEKSAEGEKAEDGKAPAEGEKTPGAEKTAEGEKAEDEAADDEQHAEDGENGIALTMVQPDEDKYRTYEFYVGEEMVAEQIVKNNETLLRPASPKKDGYKFTGWNTAADGTGETVSFGTVSDITETETVMAYAQFTPVLYVFFVDTTGRVVHTVESVPGGKVDTTGVTYPLASTELAITGWFYDEAYENRANTVTLTDKNVTVYAKVEQGHWINYNSDGGTYIAPVFYDANAVTAAPADPTKPGYTFIGWFDENGDKFSFGDKLAANVTLTAHWEAGKNTSYTLVYWEENADDDGYTFVKTESAAGTTGASVTLTNSQTNVSNLPSADRSYFTYDSAYTNEKLQGVTIDGDGSTVVNVYFARNRYTLTFQVVERSPYFPWNESVKVVATIEAKYNQKISDEFTKAPFSTTYAGRAWECTESSKYNYALQTLDRMPGFNATFNLYDKNTNTQKTIYYYVQTPGTTVSSSRWPTSSANFTLLKEVKTYFRYATYNEEYHEIQGYDRYPARTAGFDSDYQKNFSNNKLTLYYLLKSYDLNFYNGDNATAEHTVRLQYTQSLSGQAYTPERPAGVPDTFEFAGWYDNSACTGEAIDFSTKIMPLGGMNVYAKWAAPEFTGTVYVTENGSDGGTKLPIPYGGTISPDDLPKPIPPEGDGWVLAGWTTDPAKRTPFNFSTQIFSDIELYPYFTNANRYSVTYKNGTTEEGTDPKTYAINAYADVMSVAALGFNTPTDKVFLGWATTPNGNAEYQPNDKLPITGNVTLYAVYGDIEKTVTLTYNSNDENDTTREVSGILRNRLVKLEGAIFSRTGYIFDGWNTEKDGSGRPFAGGVNARVNEVGSNVLYAQWKPDPNTKYTVEYYYEQSTDSFVQDGSRKGTGTTGAEVFATADDKTPQKDGYAFDKDNGKNVLSGTIAADGSLVLKVYFKRNEITVTITGNTNTVTYNGTEQSVTGFTSDAPADVTVALKPGAEAKASGIDAGKYMMNLTAADFTATSPNYKTVTVKYTDGWLQIDKAETIEIELKGKTLTTTYTGSEQSVEGIEVVSNPANATWTLNEGKEAKASGIDANKYMMGLTAADFTATSPNYKTVTVKYTDGYLDITPITEEVTVIVTGATKTVAYNRAEQSVTGHTVNTNGLPITVTLNAAGKDTVSGTNAGTYMMGLTAADFTATSRNYTNIKLIVNDGWLKIDPITTETTVYVYGNTDYRYYNRNIQTVEGFEVGYGTDPTISVKLADGKKAIAAGRTVKTYIMGLTEKHFVATSPNYTNIKLVVEDGWLAILPNPDEIVVTIRGNSDTVTYDGKEHTVTGYTVEVEDEVFAIELRTKGKDTAKGTEPGTYNMGLTAADFRVESKNYSNVKVIVEDGALKIEPVTGPTPTPDPTEPTPTPELEDIEDTDTPTTGYTRAWALVNLICAILTVIFSVVLLIGLVGKKTKTEETENGEEVEKEIKKKKFWRFFSIVPALAAVIVFLLTEDMRLPMVFVDRWTLLMVIIGLVQALVMVFAKKTKKDPDEEEEAKA